MGITKIVDLRRNLGSVSFFLNYALTLHGGDMRYDSLKGTLVGREVKGSEPLLSQ